MQTKILAACLKRLIRLQKSLFDFAMNDTKKSVILNNAYLKQWIYAQKRLKQPKDKFYLDKICQLHEILLALNLLHYRELDGAIFEISQMELNLLNEHIASALMRLTQALFSIKMIDTDELQFAIEKFEDHYQRALQMIVKDQTIFLFFIKNLHGLREHIDGFFRP